MRCGALIWGKQELHCFPGHLRGPVDSSAFNWLQKLRKKVVLVRQVPFLAVARGNDSTIKELTHRRYPLVNPKVCVRVALRVELLLKSGGRVLLLPFILC